MLNSFTFNGRSSEEFGVRVEKFPNLNRPQRKYKATSVSGRNGNIYQLEDAWEEVPVAYKIYAGSRHKGCAVDTFTEIMEWLHSADNYAELSDSFDQTHYRMAVYVDSTDIESEWHTFGRATIRFRCIPQRYIAGCVQPVESGDTIFNPTNHVALPIIMLTGEGASSLLDMEKPEFQNNVGETKFRASLEQQFGFIGIGTGGNGKVSMTSYNNEYVTTNGGQLVGRSNTTGYVSWKQWQDRTGVGTAIAVNPDTEYTISANSNRPCRIYIAFFSNSDQMVSSTAEKSNNGGAIELTFKTPTDCNYILIEFFTTGTNTITVDHIMLAKGAEAQTFKPYEADTSKTFTINDTTLKIMLNGFDEAVIDCERENFSVDGTDNNIGVSVLDQYGNLSVDYLKLDKGENNISFSEGITAVTIDCRFWEL